MMDFTTFEVRTASDTLTPEKAQQFLQKVIELIAEEGKMPHPLYIKAPSDLRQVFIDLWQQGHNQAIDSNGNWHLNKRESETPPYVYLYVYKLGGNPNYFLCVDCETYEPIHQLVVEEVAFYQIQRSPFLTLSVTPAESDHFYEGDEWPEPCGAPIL